MFLYGFLSCTCLYVWLSISLCMGFRRAHFCTNDYPFLLNGFSSCTFLYKWLPFLFEWIFVTQISVQMTTIYFEWIFVMHIYVQMTTILLYMGFHHAHSVKITFHILSIWIFVMHISVLMIFYIILVFPCVQCSSTRE